MTDVRIEPYPGPREDLRPLLELADDSPSQLASYLHAGQVLVARSGDDVVGHLLLVDTGTAGEVELKSMAVREDVQGTGVGARLVRAALDLARDQGATLLHVATPSPVTGRPPGPLPVARSRSTAAPYPAARPGPGRRRPARR